MVDGVVVIWIFLDGLIVSLVYVGIGGVLDVECLLIEGGIV